MNRNFTSGSLVMRLWNFDGTGEVIAKFQYFDDAKDFAAMKARADAKQEKCDDWFYVAVCDDECDMQAFKPSAYAKADTEHHARREEE